MRLNIHKLFINFQSDEAHAVFVNTDGQTFGSSAVSVFRKF